MESQTAAPADTVSCEHCKQPLPGHGFHSCYRGTSWQHNSSNTVCGQCGAELVRTSEQFLSCPRGHGRLYQSWTGKSIVRELAAFWKRAETAIKRYDRWRAKLEKMAA